MILANVNYVYYDAFYYWKNLKNDNYSGKESLKYSNDVFKGCSIEFVGIKDDFFGNNFWNYQIFEVLPTM